MLFLIEDLRIIVYFLFYLDKPTNLIELEGILRNHFNNCKESTIDCNCSELISDLGKFKSN